jgi:hypothetical protein
MTFETQIRVFGVARTLCYIFFHTVRQGKPHLEQERVACA